MSSAMPPASTLSTPPSITIVLAVIILVFFCFGFFSIYFCRCVVESIVRIRHLRRSPSGDLVTVACASAHQGLARSRIDAFPSFKYSSVKDLRRDDYGLECAICLAEFDGDSVLRLLTVCDHVFHQVCIDLWLDSHKTCPVCRRILDPTDESFGKASPAAGSEPEPATREDVAIDVRDDDDDNDDDNNNNNDHDRDPDRDREEEGEGSGERREASPQRKGHEEMSKGKHSRSNTTGHSIVRERGEEDRHTLRLPDHVRNRLLRGHNWTGSCTTFGDISKNKASGRYGEGGFTGGDVNRS